MFLLEDISLMYQYVFGSSGSMYDFDGRNVSLNEVQSRGALALVLGGYGISSMISRVTAMSTSFGEAGIIGATEFSSSEVRIWYNSQLSKLNTAVEYTEPNARILHMQRNYIKTLSRMLMSDKSQVNYLNKYFPIQPIEYYINKYSSYDNVWELIITNSKKPNAIVNTKFGIK